MHTVEALDSLILFRQKPDSLLRRLMATEEAVRVAAQGELVALAVENGWQGDLWRCCIARELVSSENPFSLAWERHSGGQDTLEALALADMKLFFELLNAPPEGGAWPLLRDFRHESRRTADCASFLAFSGELAAAGSPEGLLDRLTAFYQTQGVGLLGMGQVFRARRTGNGAELVPVEDRPPVRLADLVGYRQQKDLLIGNKIRIVKNDTAHSVVTDSKWLTFMLGQIVNNSIKYRDAAKQPCISFAVEEMADKTVLKIRDNGIGISEQDIDRVFDKTFTGENGRRGNASTGMGLYICKQLCNKLGHSIAITSVHGEYTEVEIVFGKETFLTRE